MKGIVGREAEIRELQERYSSDRAQFVFLSSYAIIYGFVCGCKFTKNIPKSVEKWQKNRLFHTLWGVFYVSQPVIMHISSPNLFH